MLRFFFLIFFDLLDLQQENPLMFLIFVSLYIAAPPAGLMSTSTLSFPILKRKSRFCQHIISKKEEKKPNLRPFLLLF